MSRKQTSTCFVRFDQGFCAGHRSCLKVCPTKAIHIKKKKAVRIIEQCIFCGECIRICRQGAVSAVSERPDTIGQDHVAIALVSPVLYAQFPGVMPKDVLLGLRQMGFQHTIDMSYFLEIFQCATGNASMWAMSGGEIADMDIDRSLAVSGMEETICYLEKIDMGLFQDIEYIEFRSCREGCLGGVLNVIDKYLAKSVVQKMIKRFGLGRRLHRENILRMYEKGEFQTAKNPSKLTHLFGARKEALSIDMMQEIEKVMELIKGIDCTAFGAPDCRTFAEDVVRGEAALKDCLFISAQKRARH